MTIMIIFELSGSARVRRRLPSLVENSSTNPKVVSFIPGPVSWIMIRCVARIVLLEWSTTSQRPRMYRISVPYA